MLSLESIQADILFLLKEQDTFFGRLFSSSTERLVELRKMETKALNNFLMDHDQEYRILATSNMDLLKDTPWKLNVTQHISPNRFHSSTIGIIGHIETNGFLYGERISDLFLRNKNPCVFTGKIDHLGYMNVDAVNDGKQSFYAPTILTCCTNETGELNIEVEKENTKPIFTIQIKSVIGDPFNGKAAKRKAFLLNRKKLLNIVSKHQITRP